MTPRIIRVTEESLRPPDDVQNEIDVSVELTTAGEEDEEELKTDYLAKLADVVTWSTDWTVESLISQVRRGNIDLNPRFQRRDAWNLVKKSRLIESIIYGLPIPQIVLAADKRSRGRFIIVDGKQRLLTLKQFCTDSASEAITTVFSLKGLRNARLNGLTFDLLKERYPSLYDNFLNQSIRSVIIKNWPSDNLLYTIFFRLNTGSLGLSPQELRRSLHPGPFMDFVDDYSQSSNNLKSILRLKEPDYRMRDIDLVIRYFAFRNNASQYKGDYKPFLDDTCEHFNKTWVANKLLIERQAEELDDALGLLIRIFGLRNVFRRWHKGKYESRMSRAVFDILVYYVAGYPDYSVLEKKADFIKRSFTELCESNTDFAKSISSNTNNLVETSTRFVIWGNVMKRIDKSIKVPRNFTVRGNR